MKCVYSAAPPGEAGDTLGTMENDLNVRNQDLQSGPSRDQSVPDLPAWSFPLSPYPMDAFDFNMTDFADVPPVSALGASLERSPITPLITHDNSPATPPDQTSDESSRSTSNAPPLSTPLLFTRILSDYASSLIKGSCFTPFLHLPKTKNAEPDLPSFPFTTMAICSSTSISLSTDKQFFRRAINEARHRLIGSFVSASPFRLPLI